MSMSTSQFVEAAQGVKDAVNNPVTGMAEDRNVMAAFIKLCDLLIADRLHNLPAEGYSL